MRPIDVADPSQFINGMPDIATQINGFEIMQKSVGDCSVLSSLAVAANLFFNSSFRDEEQVLEEAHLS